MEKYVLTDLRENMQQSPGANLRERIKQSVESGVAPPPAKRRFASGRMLAVAAALMMLSATAVAAAAFTDIGWRERLEQSLLESRAQDTGYIDYFYPSVFYFSEEMQEQQRRIAELTIWDREEHENYFGQNAQRRLHYTESLGLDLYREPDEVDAALRRAFSFGSVASVRVENTPLLVGPGIFREETDGFDPLVNIIGWLDMGTHVKIAARSDSLSYLVVSFDLERPIRAWHVVEILEGEHAGRVGWVPNFILAPSGYSPDDFGFDPYHNYLEFTHPERNVTFTLHRTFHGRSAMLDNFIPYEDIAIIAADAIYRRFGFCVGGETGYMVLFEGNIGDFGGWSVAIIDESRANHPMGPELFHMTVDPVTGGVRYLGRQPN
jgi:hypothetical protein